MPIKQGDRDGVFANGPRYNLLDFHLLTLSHWQGKRQHCLGYRDQFEHLSGKGKNAVWFIQAGGRESPLKCRASLQKTRLATYV